MDGLPTVLFVHGAWHASEHFAPVQSELASHGYSIKAVQLPSSTDGNNYIQGIDEDVEAIQNTLSDIVLTDGDIVLVMHSYGGIPGSSAAKGFSKPERLAKGENGGIIHLIYIASFALEEGLCLIDGIGGQLAPWVKVHVLALYFCLLPPAFEAVGLITSIQGENTYMTPKNPRDVFYNDLSDSEAALWISELRKQATKSFVAPTTYAAWKHIPSTYVICERDNAFPSFAQEMLVSQQGAKFNVIRFEDSGHSPFLSKPQETAKVIRKAAGECK
ncbi:uncharacterized protein PV09_04588 [Verruconis gallopava]|uniref:AB hydrolase-1 domain-containing protein n=1 Tax=Verruconis gallopava TaxID=253628 RepID=A0A0D1YUD2_9PEZI|nr:uncharacterized protein PV09_04588 [Verruconis gallopava]KIW04292.1 hypothetical protein PV09_04588 [Verruconis gallopava]